ncbi:hypothetical protein FANTH_8539 [Fusarium anthophilum]|uniref:Poly [ADP-ribose] polymerase n=1 Tax=Fusarium anthophilum TaxID=48485 RepID=A0A8H4ZAW8_9HYPO|nr:hypothetical protein FANTH_8539 [Fusarium anthophilum]
MTTTGAAKGIPEVQPLRGCRIVVTKNALEKLAERLISMLGGSYRDKVDTNTTHIISTQPRAQHNGPQIVDPDFLLKIISDNGSNLDKKDRHRSPDTGANRASESPEEMKHNRVRFITAEEINKEEHDKNAFQKAVEKPSLSIPGDSEPVHERNDLCDTGVDKLKHKTGLASENIDKAIPKKHAFNSSHHRYSKSNEEAGEKILQIKVAKDVLNQATRRRKPVQELMQIIFNETGFSKVKDTFNYGSDLEDRDIEKELKALAKVAASIKRRAKNNKNAEIMKGDTILLAKDLQDIWDWKNAYEIMKVISNSGDEVPLFDRQLQSLGLQEITPLPRTSEEFKALAGYLYKYRVTYDYKLKDIFRINRREEHASLHHGKNSHRVLLWHGSRAVNYCSSLSHGLRIPPSGGLWYSKLLGNCIHLTDMSSVAADDCKTSKDALLLLCETERTRENYTEGKISPERWINAKVVNETLDGVQIPDPTLEPKVDLFAPGSTYNKYTCYNPTQVKLRYILRLDILISGMK